ncbi:MAG: alpha-L-rhamnosidase C-terminal domain-containing protein, partial [Clostridia bacterium]|nr:alpha-L-rhamnosidase C-terminal domain-containing protein [Clostridia bacterium]
YLENKNPGLIIEKEEDGSWCLGDWCIPVEGYAVEEVDLNALFKELPPGLVNTAYFYHCVSICIDFGRILGRDTTYYERLAGRIRNRFNEKYLDKAKGVYHNGKHMANVYALYFKIAPDDYNKAVLESLIREIEASEYRMDAGIFAASMVFKVLADARRTDIIDRMLLCEDHPSYGYMKKNGATTLWETWDGSASLNHPMFGGVVSFFYKYLAGIRYIGKERRILIEPIFPESMDDFKAALHCIYGVMEVSWERKSNNKGKTIIIRIKLPGNTTGAMKYGDEALVIQNGTEAFIIDPVSKSISRGDQ